MAIKIKNLSTTGGYLEKASIVFADGLNCIIGSRGTCKSTVVETIRFLFDADQDKIREMTSTDQSDQSDGIAVHASIETRRAALAVLKAYGDTEKDYFSMKMIVACQSLIIQGFQEGAIRAGIRAISRILSKL